MERDADPRWRRIRRPVAVPKNDTGWCNRSVCGNSGYRGKSPTVMRDHEYKRHGTLTLMAGIDLLTGHVHALVKDRHRSREFIEFLKLLDAAYPADAAIEVILDNHSAHVSRETTTWLAAQPIGRFSFTFTPTDPWLVAQSHRRLLFQAGAFAIAPHPRQLKTRTQATPDGLHRRPQPRARRPHLALQNRSCSLSHRSVISETLN